ncbi:MAG: ImmA/IrrE family metallo-endopeptidase [Dehalococcoidia bacterium]
MNNRTGKVPLVAPRSRADIAARAIAVVRDFRPELLQEPGRFPIEDFWDLGLERYGLRGYVSDNLGPFDEGITRPDGTIELSSAVFDALGRDDGRARFTTSHEVGHGILHVREIKEALVSGRTGLRRSQDVQIFRNPEWQADEFASFLLMPLTAVRELIRRNLWNDRREFPGIMSHTFGVSPRAAEVYLEKTKLWNQQTIGQQ